MKSVMDASPSRAQSAMGNQSCFCLTESTRVEPIHANEKSHDSGSSADHDLSKRPPSRRWTRPERGGRRTMEQQQPSMAERHASVPEPRSSVPERQASVVPERQASVPERHSTVPARGQSAPDLMALLKRQTPRETITSQSQEIAITGARVWSDEEQKQRREALTQFRQMTAAYAESRQKAKGRRATDGDKKEVAHPLF